MGADGINKKQERWEARWDPHIVVSQRVGCVFGGVSGVGGGGGPYKRDYTPMRVYIGRSAKFRKLPYRPHVMFLQGK